MYIYVKNGNIIHKSENKKQLLWFLEWCQVYEDNQVWNLIFEDGKIKVYEKSKQREEDSNKYHLTKENTILKKKNYDLTRIANNKIRKEMELDIKGQEPNEYQRKLYLLRNMKDAHAKEGLGQ